MRKQEKNLGERRILQRGRAQKKAALAEKEAKKMEEMLPLLNSDVNKHTNRSKEIEHNDLIKEIDKEFKLPYLKELFMYYYYGMKKGELNGKKKAELVTLLADKVTSEDSNTTL